MSKQRGYFEEYLVQNMLQFLEEQGKRLCQEAAATTNTGIKTGQLRQGYFFVVCYNGIIYKFGDTQGVVSRNWQHSGLNGTGWAKGFASDWDNDFFEGINGLMTKIAPKYRIHGFRSFDLFILNAAFYTEFLESGSYAKGLSKMLGASIEPKDWQVISQIRTSCDELAKNTWKNTRVFKIGLNGQPLRPNNRS